MDSKSFDRLTRMVGERRTRRGVIGAAAGALAALVGGAALADEAGAQGRRTCRPVQAGCTKNGQCCSNLCQTNRRAPRNQRNRCVCPDGIVACNGACCPEGLVCDGRQCVEPPPPCDGLTCTAAGLHPSYASHCFVTTACQVVEGCDYEHFAANVLNFPYDDPVIGLPCKTDSDCPTADGIFSYCVVGWQYRAATNWGPGSSDPFAYYDGPQCVYWMDSRGCVA
jgi:hypothetical protein